MSLKFKNITNYLQTITNATKGELILFSIVFFGLLSGSLYKIFNKDFENETKVKSLYAFSDSLYHSQHKIDSFPEFKSDTIENHKQYVIKLDKNSAEQININNAQLMELMKIPEIGKKTAENIIEYRKTNKFKKPEEIMNIKGIGEKKFEKIKKFIRLKD